MNIEEFRNMVVKALQERFHNEVTVQKKDVIKNNGIILHGVSIERKGVNISPCIYMEKFYEQFEDGSGMGDILDQMERTYEESPGSAPFNTEMFRDYKEIRGLLSGRLVNTQKNVSRLKKMPHRHYLDLSLIYAVEIPMGDGIGGIQVTNEHMRMWNVSEEDLFKQTMDNMDREGDACIQSLSDALKEMLGGEGMGAENDNGLYILTNSQKIHGASQLIRESVLKRAGDILGNDYMIIPSSIHELLLVPDNGEPDMAQSIATMVDEVNRTQVAEDEILSFHVYRYSRSRGQISIAA